jgi:hypothetical protein
MSAMKTITLYDVARLAGVSYQTVSRVINQGEHVSARTREKVLAAMAELHYIPNRGAQQLAGKRTKTLGLLTSDLALHAPSQIASAVKSRATQSGVNVIISMPEVQDARDVLLRCRIYWPNGSMGCWLTFRWMMNRQRPYRHWQARCRSSSLMSVKRRPSTV